MNEARMRRLASEGRTELTRKMLRKLSVLGLRGSELASMLARCELKDENVFAYPDFACKLGLPGSGHPLYLICVQTGDGRTARIVGLVGPALSTSSRTDR